MKPMDFHPPKPLPPIHTSTPEQIKDRIDFASSLLSHPHYNPPPATRLNLEDYKTLCNHLLHHTSQGKEKQTQQLEKATLLTKIHHHETTLKPKTLLLNPLTQTLTTHPQDLNLTFPPTDLQTLTTETLHLHLQVLLTRYGSYIPRSEKDAMDYYSPVPLTGNADVRQTPQAGHGKTLVQSRAERWHAPFWAMVYSRLVVEKPYFNAVLTGGSLEGPYNCVPVTLLWVRVCHVLNLDVLEMERVVWFVLDPGVGLPDGEIMDYVLFDDPGGLARRLKRDLLVVPDGGVEGPVGRDLEVVFEVVGALQDGLFDLGRSRFCAVVGGGFGAVRDGLVGGLREVVEGVWAWGKGGYGDGDGDGEVESDTWAEDVWEFRKLAGNLTKRNMVSVTLL
ncbi:hypothetical protein BDV28DRAFT_147047 [Aspergillus coremiiformis]|uniref:Uncharacterized protein n=1 Tax=Aspergillus coremiiformis TaxID=138285 RepID=A0A5N6ZC98_9EURO|nr:hypothetical protein BDV28DRAFT_147047 [Aspergillus coremiiformis]